MILDKLDVAWAAGFFDGEGCVGITKTGAKGYRLILQVSQVNQAPLKKFEELFGGSICLSEKRGKHRPIWRWCQASQQAGETLRYLLPLLISKKEVAELAIYFQDMKKFGKNLSEEQIQKELQIKEKISELNQRD